MLANKAAGEICVRVPHGHENSGRIVTINRFRKPADGAVRDGGVAVMIIGMFHAGAKSAGKLSTVVNGRNAECRRNQDDRKEAMIPTPVTRCLQIAF